MKKCTPIAGLIVFVVLILLIILTNCTQIQKVEIGKFEKSPCPLDLPEGLVEGENFIFGYVNVPEQHAHPEEQAIRLAVAIFPSYSDNPSPDPLVLNSGGPGDSNLEDFIPSLSGEAGKLLLEERDAVVIELRGLLHSEPNLVCQEIFDVQIDMLEQNLSAEKSIQRLLESIRASHDRFVNEGVNLSAFNNIENAADIAMVMTALGYDKFNLFGTSAGTILAQHVMRDYPGRLRSVILNAVVPLGRSLHSMPANATEMLKHVFKLCAEDEACNEAFPNLEADFLNLLDRLNDNPVMVELQNPATGDTVNFVLNGDRLGQWLFSVMYANTQLPYTLNKIITGDYSPVRESADIFFPMYRFSYGLNYSIFCSEFVDYTPADVRIEGPYSTFMEGAASSWFGAKLMPHVREIWDVPMLDARAREPIKCDVPTLIFSGELDHVCPPHYAQQLADGLSNAYLYTFPGVAHSPIDAGPCAILMAKDFLNDPTRAPDSSCIENFKLQFITE